MPYDPPDGRIQPNPEIKPKDFVVISVGGNDFALRGEMNPTEILKYVREVIQFYKNKGVNPNHIFYMTPYSPTGLMKFGVALMCKSLSGLYSQYIRESKQLCEEEGINIITLDHFTNKERVGPGTGIPEPTREGALALAVLIQKGVLRWVKEEENCRRQGLSEGWSLVV